MKSLSCLFILACAAVLHADAVDDAVKKSMDADHVPGVCIAVVRPDDTADIRSYGTANLELGVKVTPDTVFRIASLSKQFCAMAVLAAKKDGRLELNQPISKYLPEAPEAWRDITVRHLLNHTSGIKDPGNRFVITREYTVQQYVDLLAAEPLETKPGEAYKYSSPGYTLLGIIVEKVMGKPLRSVVQERVFDPIGMKSSSYFEMERIVPNRSGGYQWLDGKIANSQFLRPRIYDGSGGVMTSMNDLVKYELALRHGPVPSRETLAEMWTPGELNNGTKLTYGMGWGVTKIGTSRVVRHGGDTWGFTAYFIRDLTKNFTVLVLRNTGENKADTLGRDIYDAVVKQFPDRKE